LTNSDQKWARDPLPAPILGRYLPAFSTAIPEKWSTRTSVNALDASFLRCRSGNAPFDHQDLQCVVYNQARDHCVDEHRERLPPRQRHESRKTHACQDRADEGIRREGCNQRLAGHRRPERAALPRGHDGEHGKVEEQQEAKRVEGIVAGRQAEMRPADPQ
jgi:hypothetical protein